MRTKRLQPRSWNITTDPVKEVQPDSVKQVQSMNDFTFIIQGPYNVAHLSMLDDLKKEGKVVLSCYMPDLDKIKDPSVYDMILLNDVIDTNIAKIYNYDNVYHQVRSTKRALCSINTEYSVKFRSDSYYSGIPYVTDSIRKNSEKLSCTPLNVNPVWPYQFCDHVMAGKTKTLRDTFEIAESTILNQDFIYDGIDTRVSPVALLVISWLKGKKIKGDEYAFNFWIDSVSRYSTIMNEKHERMTQTVYQNYIETVVNNINILDIYKMEPFFCKSNTMGRTFNKAIDAVSVHDSQYNSGHKMNDMNSYIKAFDSYYGGFFRKSPTLYIQ
jgi:hypothetical protein